MTLNHDTLVEQLFGKNDIPYIDGFGPVDGDFRFFDDRLYDAENVKVRVFKPHGSVEWYRVLGMNYPAIFCGEDIQNCKLGSGEAKKISIKTPAFLSGVNKVVSYNRGIYSEIFYRVHQVFKQNQSVVMSGYGWGDTAINFRIMNWLDYTNENAIMLLHQNPEELAEGYRALVEKGNLKPVKQWLSQAHLSDVEKFILRD